MNLDNIYQVKIDHIRSFLFFCEFRSVKKTSRYFGVTKQALFKSFSNIEKVFESNIFRKKDGSYSDITENGEILRKYAIDFMLKLKRSSITKKRALILSYENTTSRKFLTNICKKSYEELPDQSIDLINLEYKTIVKMINIGEIDLGIVDSIDFNDLYNENIESIKLLNYQDKWIKIQNNSIFEKNKYIHYKYLPFNISNFTLASVITEDLELCLEMVINHNFFSYVPYSKVIDSECESDIIEDSLDFKLNKYLIYNKKYESNILLKLLNIIFSEKFE